MTWIKIGLVFVVLFALLWWLRRYDAKRVAGARRSTRPVEVLGNARLGRNASVAVVRIGAATYALGVTEHNVRLLTELPPQDAGVLPTSFPVDAGLLGGPDDAVDAPAPAWDAARGADEDLPARPTFRAALGQQFGQLAPFRAARKAGASRDGDHEISVPIDPAEVARARAALNHSGEPAEE